MSSTLRAPAIRRQWRWRVPGDWWPRRPPRPHRPGSACRPTGRACNRPGPHPATGRTDSLQGADGAVPEELVDGRQRLRSEALEPDLDAAAGCRGSLLQLPEVGQRCHRRFLQRQACAGSQRGQGKRRVGLDGGGHDDHVGAVVARQEGLQIGVDRRRGRQRARRRRIRLRHGHEFHRAGPGQPVHVLQGCAPKPWTPIRAIRAGVSRRCGLLVGLRQRVSMGLLSGAAVLRDAFVYRCRGSLAFRAARAFPFPFAAQCTPLVLSYVTFQKTLDLPAGGG